MQRQAVGAGTAPLAFPRSGLVSCGHGHSRRPPVDCRRILQGRGNGPRLGCDCVQLFTKNNNQWRGKTIAADEAERFRAALADSGITHPLAHNSYLINLASPDAALWRKSVDAMVQELLRAAVLGIPYVVAHPGAYTGGSEVAGLGRIVAALDEIDRQTRTTPVGCLLETTAGQGTSIGWRFEQLAAILAGVRNPDRLGVCFDTCHVLRRRLSARQPEIFNPCHLAGCGQAPLHLRHGSPFISEDRRLRNPWAWP